MRPSTKSSPLQAYIQCHRSLTALKFSLVRPQLLKPSFILGGVVKSILSLTEATEKTQATLSHPSQERRTSTLASLVSYRKATDAERLFEETIQELESHLNCTRSPFNLDDVWRETRPVGQNESLDKATRNISSAHYLLICSEHHRTIYSRVQSCE